MTEAIWTDGGVMEAMYAMHSALNEWQEVGAAEEVDLDAMDDVQSRFSQALSEYQLAVQVFNERQRKTA
jgi:hypothetical protein